MIPSRQYTTAKGRFVVAWYWAWAITFTGLGVVASVEESTAWMVACLASMGFAIVTTGFLMWWFK